MSASLNANEVFITHLVNGQSITVTTGADSEARIERSLREKEVHHQRIGAASSSTIGNNLPDMDVTIRCVRGTATVSDPVAASAGGGDVTAAGDNTFTGTNVFAGPFHIGVDWADVGSDILAYWGIVDPSSYISAPIFTSSDAESALGLAIMSNFLHDASNHQTIYAIASGKYVAGIASDAIGSIDGTWASGGMFYAEARGADVLHANLRGIYVWPNSAEDGAVVQDNHGILVDDQNIAGATNYAMKTGLGQNYLGDSLTWRPPASIAPVANGDLTVEATSNTTLTFKLKGSDGTVRTGTLTLS